MHEALQAAAGRRRIRRMRKLEWVQDQEEAAAKAAESDEGTGVPPEGSEPTPAEKSRRPAST